MLVFIFLCLGRGHELWLNVSRASICNPGFSYTHFNLPCSDVKAVSYHAWLNVYLWVKVHLKWINKYLFICTLHWWIVCKLGWEKHSHLGRGNLNWRIAFIKLVSRVFCSFIKQGLGHCGQWPHKVVRLGMYNKSSWARRGKGDLSSAFPCSLHHFLLPDTCLEFFSWLLSMMK